MLADLKAWNADPDVVRRFEEEQAAPEVFDVLPRNGETVALFLAVCTQFRTGAMGGVTGLDYSGVDIAIRRLDIDVSREHWQGLQIMERTVMETVNKKLKDG